jgi:hypothetical protein
MYQHLDYKPKRNTNSEKEQNVPSLATKPKLNTSTMTLRQKLETLNELLVDACIDNLQGGQIKPNDLGAIVTLLKNNKVVEEKRELSESDFLDTLIVSKKDENNK